MRLDASTARGLRALAAVGALVSLGSPIARAFPRSLEEVPCEPTAEPCVLCHQTRDGGRGCPSPPCLDAFGADLVGRTWAELAPLDSDGDGFTNGEELADPDGRWTRGTAHACRCASDPGDPASVPPHDGDGDGVACSLDCDDADPSVGECPCAGPSDCDDRDPCTVDRCVAAEQRCEHVRGPGCTDAAAPRDAGPGATGAGCTCRAAPLRGGSRFGPLLALGALALLVRGRRGAATSVAGLNRARCAPTPARRPTRAAATGA
ncbi:MAG: hypothetical protein KF729_19160 [Sandaracinaceae bacterium]|nr:hypothetical protein [Sandaracinaceae bacterium]